MDHAYGVEPSLTPRQRYEVKLRFENSPVELVGLGTNWVFHYPDAVRGLGQWPVRFMPARLFLADLLR